MLTEARRRITRALPALPRARPARTVRIGVMLVPDVVPEVYLVFAREEAYANRVDGRVAPPLPLSTRFSICT